MDYIIALIKQIGFSTGLWLFAIAFALHELEEWNILSWYQRNYIDLPPSTNQAVRVWIIFVSLIGFIWCALATLPGNPVIAAYLFLPAIAVAMQNALQHIFWLFHFKGYAPGIITSIFFLIPLGVTISFRAISDDLVPIWYVGFLLLLIIPGLVQTVKARNRMTKPIRAVHHFSIKLAELLGRFG